MARQNRLIKRAEKKAADKLAAANRLIKRAEKKAANKLAAAINCAEKAKMKTAKLASYELEVANNLAECASYKHAEENERVAAAKEAADKLAAVTNCTERASLSKIDSKWVYMFECLEMYIEGMREKATRHMNDEQKAAWIWDGNVPQSFKTPCGKALGRWIDRQRQLKANKTLNDDRELRLTSKCLRWKMTGGGVPSP
jgi:nitrate reductase assembly molybdenum cofactor insertion protein NarJ